MRIAIDTNLWVSGLLWKGLPWELLRLTQAKEVELCMTPAMIEELAQVLSYEKFRPRLEQLRLSSADLLAYAIDLTSLFDVTENGPTIVAADPDDDTSLRCAVAPQPAYVVFGDHHLLDLEEYAGIPILNVHEFLDQAFPERISDASGSSR